MTKVMWNPRERGDDQNPLWGVAFETLCNEPQLWSLFERYSLEAVRSGREHYSARTIFERIRWHMQIEINDRGEFKINDHWPPYFSRVFMWSHPHLGPSCWQGDPPDQRPWGFRTPLVNDGFFELRTVNTNFAVEEELFAWARAKR